MKYVILASLFLFGASAFAAPKFNKVACEVGGEQFVVAGIGSRTPEFKYANVIQRNFRQAFAKSTPRSTVALAFTTAFFLRTNSLEA